MDDPSFDDLRRITAEQEAITALHIEGRGASGPIVLNRNLDQIVHESAQLLQQLGGSVNPVLSVGKDFAAKHHDVAAHNRAAAEVSAIKTQAFIEERDFADIDLDGYLEHSYQELLMDVVADSRESLSQEMQKWFWTSQRSEWDSDRSKLVKQMALQIEKIVDHQQIPLQQLQHQQALLGPDAQQLGGIKRERAGRAGLDEKMQQYAEVVEFIVDPTSQLQPMSVSGMLRNIGRRRHDNDTSDLNRAVSRTWDIVHQLFSSMTNVQDTTDHMRPMVEAAAKYLGNQYKDLVIEIEKPGFEGGSVMDPYEAYMKHEQGIYTENYEGGHQPLAWQHVYLRLRCWQLYDALDYARRYLAHDNEFVKALDSWVKKGPYAGGLQDSGHKNPFKKVLYSLVKHEGADNFDPQIIETSEDFIWYRMAHLYAKNDSDRLKKELGDLQRDVVSWGHASFSTYPLVYLQVLLLTQQFEQAVAYWWDPRAPGDCSDDFTGPRGVEAVHLALALMDTEKRTQQKLLVFADGTNSVVETELLVARGTGGHEWMLDLVEMLTQFTKQFQLRDPKLAMHYLAMIPDHRRRVDSIVNLATETRDYSRLFLTKRPRRNPGIQNQNITDPDRDNYKGEYWAPVGQDGCGLEGGDVLHKLMRYTNRPEDAMEIMHASAMRASTQGNWEEAIDLFMTSKNYGRAVDVLTQQLESNYRRWQKGTRNQVLLERARRVLGDEGLCQGPAAGGPTSMDMGDRNMQESVRSLKKLYTVAQFFDTFEKGEQARNEFELKQGELARTAQLQQVSKDQYSQPGHPLRQKREQVQLFYKNALAYLADSGNQPGWHDHPQLLPVFLSAPGQSTYQIGSVISKLVEECNDEYRNELRVGVQSAVMEMIGPVCRMQDWLFKDEEQFGHPSTKANNKEVLKMTNRAMKEFAVASGLPTGDVSDMVRRLPSQ